MIVYDEALTESEIEERYDLFYSEIQKPYLTKNDNDVFHLFYTLYDGNTFISDLKVTIDYGECPCSEWINTTECIGLYQKVNRTCHPVGCQSNLTYWTETVYCGILWNQSQGIYPQQKQTWTKQTSCETDWVLVGKGVAECSPESIQIPMDCVNITVTETATPSWDTNLKFGCGSGYYDLKVCNPSYDCFNQTYVCTQLNVSSSKISTSYLAGDIATGYSSLVVNDACKCEWFIFNYGIHSFKLRESLTVTCDIPCRNEWYCLNNDYRVYRQLDCTWTNETFCSNGCSNGVCRTDTTDDPGNVLGGVFWIDFFVNPTTTQKLIQALAGSFVLGIFGLNLDKGNEKGLLLFLVGFAPELRQSTHLICPPF